MKFYFVEFTHLKTQKVFYKFGITSKKDVLERFNSKYDERYAEFYIKVMFSYYNKDDDLIKNMEELFISKYPKNFILENYLNLPYRYYDNLSGITETVLLTDTEVRYIQNSLYKFKTTTSTKI